MLDTERRFVEGGIFRFPGVTARAALLDDIPCFADAYFWPTGVHRYPGLGGGDKHQAGQEQHGHCKRPELHSREVPDIEIMANQDARH